MALKKYCRNCFHPLPSKAKFCPECGQRDTDGKVRMSELLRRFWNTTFHLEGKFLRMVWQLLNPGHVTLEYFKGKHRRYPHPVQFYLILMFFLLVFINWRRKGDTSGRGMNFIHLTADAETVDELKGKILLSEALRENMDSLPAPYRGPAARQAMDSLLHFTERQQRIGSFRSDSIYLGFGSVAFGLPARIAQRDAVELSPDSLCRLYGVEKTIPRTVLRQTLRSAKEGSSLLNTYIAASTWANLVQIALMALLLGVLFQRPQRLYVEHFVLQLHFHSGFIFLMLLVLLLRRSPLRDFTDPRVLLLWALASSYVAFWRFYRNSWGRTLLKWLVFWTVYGITLVIVFLLSLFICFLVF
jgi:hypothetical protein